MPPPDPFPLDPSLIAVEVTKVEGGRVYVEGWYTDHLIPEKIQGSLSLKAVMRWNPDFDPAKLEDDAL